MATEPKPAVILAAQLARETRNVTAYKAARDAEALCRLGKRAAKRALDRCNGIQRYDAQLRHHIATWTEADDAKADKATADIEAKATVILRPYGGNAVNAGGDPRGFTLKFQLKSGASNGMDQNRWGL